jgi:CubicO group peptidase (beta-lactamase class C family)/polyisoprenoid-binding protein YceI
MHVSAALKAAFGLCVILGLRSVHAVEKVFDFQDPKKIGSVSLYLDSPLEPIFGSAKGISGTVQFDPEKPLLATGKISVDVSSVEFANAGYTATAQGYALNARKFPQVVLTLRKVVRFKKLSPTRYQGLVDADFLCRGISKPKRLEVTADYFPGRAEERTNGNFKGDLLVVRTKFEVSRSEHGISQGIPSDLVGDSIEVSVAVVGTHYAAPAATQPSSKTTLLTKPTRRWLVEAGDLDQPSLLHAQVEDGHLTVAKGNESVSASVFDTQRTSLSFRLPANDILGAGLAHLAGSGNVLIGDWTGLGRSIPLRAQEVDHFPPTASEPINEFPSAFGHKGISSTLIKRRMRELKVPGLAAVRIEGGKPTEEAFFGNRTSNFDAPVSPLTLFQVGSMGSPLIDIAIVRLAASGKISLMANANQYLPEPLIPETGFNQGGKVTVADLLKSTSGLTQYKFRGYSPDTEIPPLAELLQGADPGQVEPLKVATVPGKVFREAATNEALLQVILERSTGHSLQRVITENIFGPCGMTHSTYDPLNRSPQSRQMAWGFYSSGEPTLSGYHRYPSAGQAGLWTTADDFGKFLSQAMRMLKRSSNSLLGQSAMDMFGKLETSHALLGFEKGRYGQYFRGGAPYGFYSKFIVYPDRGRGALILENCNLSYRLADEAIRSMLVAGGKV